LKPAEDLCSEAGAETEDILDAVIVGNTAMHHLILGLPPVRQLATSPLVPAIRGGITVKARDMGLGFAPGAYVYFPSNIAGFVGADHVAALTATAGEWGRGNGMVVDIGTKHFLLSSTKRKEVGDLLWRITYLELAGTPEFGKAFTDSCLLEPYYLNRNAGTD
jgi:uncharacterized 2Fe-2S/4Fe-4S cluster protein (DUF4445 family)